MRSTAIVDDDFFEFSSQDADVTANDQAHAIKIRDEGMSFLMTATPPAATKPEPAATLTEPAATQSVLSRKSTQTKSVLSVLEQFPRVKDLFCLTNAATPSSAPVERIFSSAGLIFLPRRNRLHDSTFEHLLFLKKNAAFMS